MHNEPIAWQIIIMIISALGLILWTFVQKTLNAISKRLSNIANTVNDFNTYRAVHDETHKQVNSIIYDIKQRVEEHDELLDKHINIIDNIYMNINQNKQGANYKRRRNDKTLE